MNKKFIATIALAAASFVMASPANAVLMVSGFTASFSSLPSGELLQSSATISNPGATTDTITLFVGQGDLFALTAPPSLHFQSSIDVEVVIGGAANSLSFFSCIDENNFAVFECGLGAIDTPTLTPSIMAIGSSSGSNSIDLLSLADPYGMGHQLVITLEPLSVITFSASSELTQGDAVAIPEPAPLVLLLSALLGWVCIRSRRRETASV